MESINTRNGSTGALKRTNTPNKMEVNPAKKAKIKAKKKANNKNSFDCIAVIVRNSRPPVNNRKVKNNRTELSIPFNIRDRFKDSQINGRKIPAMTDAGAAFRKPKGEYSVIPKLYRLVPYVLLYVMSLLMTAASSRYSFAIDVCKK